MANLIVRLNQFRDANGKGLSGRSLRALLDDGQHQLFKRPILSSCAEILDFFNFFFSIRSRIVFTEYYSENTQFRIVGENAAKRSTALDATVQFTLWTS